MQRDDALLRLAEMKVDHAYLMCLRLGLTPKECEGLVSRAHGVDGAFTPRELKRLLFLQERCKNGLTS